MLQPALNNFLELNPGKKASGSCLKLQFYDAATGGRSCHVDDE